MVNQTEDRFNGVIASLAIKAPCKTVTDGVGNILLEGEQTINTIAVVAGDRVLVMEQTDPVQNGIYNVRTSTWDRAADWDGNRDVVKGTLVTVNRPTNNLTSYVQVNLGVGQDEPTIDIDPVNFEIYFTQTSSLDDLDDVDLTGCSDDDMMHFVGGVLVCTLGQLQYDGVTLQNAGPISVSGFSNEGPQLRAVQSADLVATVNPRRNDSFTGIGGAFGNLDFLHDNNATNSFLGMRLRKQADLFSTRSWNVEGISASTTQTQGEKPVKSSLVRVTVVANANDVITLRAPELGMDQIIMNRGANVLQIFPASGDDLGAGTDASITVLPGGAIWFVGIDGDTWHLMSVSTGAAGGPLPTLRGAKSVHTAFITWPRNDLPDFLIPSATGASEVILTFNIDVYDTDNIHDPLLNASRWTMPAGFTKFEMIIGYKLDSLGTAQAGLGHVRLRKNGITNLGVDTIQVGAWIPWNSDSNAGGTNQSGGGTGEAGMQHWYSGLVNMDAGDYVEVLILTQAGSRDTPANGFWAEFRLLG